MKQKELFEDDYPVNNKIIENLKAEDEVMIDLNKIAEDEKVNHPKHYNRDGAMEMIDELEVVFGRKGVILFCKMNAWKYRYRAGLKGGEDKAIDMAKSDWYLKKAKELQDGKVIQSE